MNWKIEVKPSAEGQHRKLDKKTRQRILSALRDLEGAPNPLFSKGVKALTGSLKGDYRLRVGNWRILFTPNRSEYRIYVYAILPRGNSVSYPHLQIINRQIGIGQVPDLVIGFLPAAHFKSYSFSPTRKSPRTGRKTS